MCFSMVLILKERRGRFFTIILKTLGGGVQVIEIEECEGQHCFQDISIRGGRRRSEGDSDWG